MSIHASRAHSALSPSKFKSVEISPAYEADPTDPEHPITAEGTLCHEALDSGDDSKLTTDEQRSWVAMCREFTAEVLPGAAPHNEVKLDILDGIWGFADLLLVKAPKAALIDYKFGFNLQEPCETNPAAQAYVLGIMRAFPDIDEVFVAYLYPRLGQVSTATYTRADLPMIETRIRLIVEKARDAKPETCRWSAETCRFCRHRFACPTLQKAVLPIAQRYAETHDMALPKIDRLDEMTDGEAMSRLLEAAPVFEAVADSIKRNAVRMRVDSGIDIPGWDVRTRAGRKVIANAVLAAPVLRSAGLDDTQLLRCAEFKAGQIEDVLGEIAPKGKKKKLVEKTFDQLRDAGVLEDKPESTFMARAKAVAAEV